MDVEILWILLGAALSVAGLIGCFLPVIPGPPLSFLGLLVLQLLEPNPFGSKFIWIMGVITVVVTALDYFIPVYGTKKFGGSKSGVRGSIIGLIVGLFFFPPFGIILGPLIGAFIGELINGTESKKAMKAALGSFAGFLAGTLLKVILSLVMIYYFIVAIIEYF